ncbi:hypothetical protein AARAC_002743 [Aspergillus arachidicola]|uniref:Enoyl reductase (ER) domain-containing protein n=1 Tax=Aspergillus arachidicola TaxID=656916 RepID=A0A2G7EMI5_9EURO|nr:hypothetical protein AARAC_002743 [Aspergillus arachidicola]
MAENKSSWISNPGKYPVEVKSGPKPEPGQGQIVIKSAAVAINPLDWKIQAYGFYLEKYPFILGQDVAGVVDAVGPGVTRFSKGQRVIAHCHGFLSGDPANSAFQNYPIAIEPLTAAIPDHLSFEEACVLPLAVSTASAGLYQKDYLNLPLPSLTKVEPLASASGLRVITTASLPNHALVKALGADLVFDYKSPTVVDDIARAIEDTDFVGAYDAIAGSGSFEAVAAIMGKLNKFAPVASVLPYDKPTEQFAPKFILAYDIIKEPHRFIGDWIWGTFVPQALANGTLQAKPDPLVVGTSIEAIQHALDVQKRGVSAKKVVVTL